jgi:hypothetical protein
MPNYRYWLSGEEKKLLWKLRTKKPIVPDNDYWTHLVPRTDEELNFRLDTIPDTAIEEWTTVPSAWIWEDLNSEKLSKDNYDNYKDWLDANKKYMTPSGVPYLPDPTLQTKTGVNALLIWTPITPYTLTEPLNPVSGNRFESREWRPDIKDNGQWRKASEWECEHWDELVICQLCGHPSIPQSLCYVCNATLVQLPITKRVLQLHCILPDISIWTSEETVADEAEGILEDKNLETTDLEDIIEDKDKDIEREED